MQPHLVLPSPKYKESFLSALAEFEPQADTSRLDQDKFINGDFDAMLKIFEDIREGKNLPEGYVPETIYWLVDDSKFIGRLAVRHMLNEKLRNLGGHIGYAIRPSERSKGYGSLILKLGLEKAHEHGIEKALVTCKKTNEASRKIIEKNGGVFENEYTGEDGIITLRFWVPTS